MGCVAPQRLWRLVHVVGGGDGYGDGVRNLSTLLSSLVGLCILYSGYTGTLARCFSRVQIHYTGFALRVSFFEMMRSCVSKVCRALRLPIILKARIVFGFYRPRCWVFLGWKLLIRVDRYILEIDLSFVAREWAGPRKGSREMYTSAKADMSSFYFYVYFVFCIWYFFFVGSTPNRFLIKRYPRTLFLVYSLFAAYKMEEENSPFSRVE